MKQIRHEIEKMESKLQTLVEEECDPIRQKELRHQIGIKKDEYEFFTKQAKQLQSPVESEQERLSIRHCSKSESSCKKSLSHDRGLVSSNEDLEGITEMLLAVDLEGVEGRVQKDHADDKENREGQNYGGSFDSAPGSNNQSRIATAPTLVKQGTNSKVI